MILFTILLLYDFTSHIHYYYTNPDHDHCKSIIEMQSTLKELGQKNIILIELFSWIIKGYHSFDVTVHYVYGGYPVNEKFLYLERLNDIFHRIKSAGLYHLWEQQQLQDKEKTYLRHVERNHKLTNAKVETFEFPAFLFYGWATSFVVLILEIVWKRFDFPLVKKIVRTIDGKFGLQF